MRTSLTVIAVCLLTLQPPTRAAAEVIKPNVSTASAPIAAADASEVMTLTEAAALLRIDAEAIARLAKAQQIPARLVDTEWRFSRSALLIWLAGERQVRTTVDPAIGVAEGAEGKIPIPVTALTAEAQSAIVARGTSASTGETVPTADAEPIGAPPEQRTAAEVFLRDQQVLLAPKEFTLDVGVFYTRRDIPVLAGSQSGTTLANAESESLTTQVIGRYSVFKDTEVFASTSYSRQQATLYAGNERLSRAERSEAGDIGIGLRRTLLHEGPGRPDVIWTVDARIPTGETSKAVGTAVTLVKSLDPVVLFGTVGYRRTFSRDFTDTTRLEPKRRIDLTLGYAFALNDTLSLNTAVTGSFAGATKFRNAELRSNDTSSLMLGMTARIARGIYLQPSLSYRLNGPGSGFVLGLNVPIAFSQL